MINNSRHANVCARAIIDFRTYLLKHRRRMLQHRSSGEIIVRWRIVRRPLLRYIGTSAANGRTYSNNSSSYFFVRRLANTRSINRWNRIDYWNVFETSDRRKNTPDRSGKRNDARLLATISDYRFIRNVYKTRTSYHVVIISRSITITWAREVRVVAGRLFWSDALSTMNVAPV